MQFIPKFRQEMEDHYDHFTSGAVDFLQDILGLIAFSNQRTIHNNVAALIANRTGMREKVLSRFDLPPKTRQMKSSAFTSVGVFGELPQAFLDKFTGATSQQLVARDRKKNNTGGKGRGKRSYDYNNNYNPPASKNGKFNNYQPP